MRDDLFTVVFDQVKTDTAMYADVVLPATTFLESYDIARAYGSYAMQMVQPVIDAVGEARSNMEVFSDLAARLGIADMPGGARAGGEPETDAETLLRVLSRHAGGDALAAARRRHRDAAVRGAADPVRGHLPEHAGSQGPSLSRGSRDAGAGGHLQLSGGSGDGQISARVDLPASEKTISSMLGQLRTRTASLFMHPQDAAARELSHGDAVRVFNDLGEIHCLLHIGDAIAPGTVSLPKGLWRKSTMNRSTATALAPDTLTDLGGGACFNDARVEVVRILDASWEGQPISFYVPDTTDTVH